MSAVALELQASKVVPSIADIASARDNAVMGTVERAFQLAPSCRTINELRAKLTREGHTNIDAHLQGSLRRELKKLMTS